MKIKKIVRTALAALFFASCALNLPELRVLDMTGILPTEGTETKEWTFIIYMAADNDLESAAIQDFNELEAARIDRSKINLLALIDRGPGHDSTNGNWTDTRLYEIACDSAGANTVIASRRVACPPLGLTETGTNELDLSNPVVLEYLTRYVKDAYPAERTALIFWGHGTGWRSGDATGADNRRPERAIAIDDTSSGYMGISDANRAIAESGITVLGFDTCFGALLEIAYEFEKSADWLAASEGPTPSTGWDYTELFSRFMESDLSPSAFGGEVTAQYAAQYGETPGAGIAFIDLSAVSRLRSDFESLARVLADSVATGSEALALRSMMLDDANLVHEQVWPCDAFIDIAGLASLASVYAGTLRADAERQAAIGEAAAGLREALAETVAVSWPDKPYMAGSIGVFLTALTAPGVPRTPHSPEYTRDSGSAGQSAFVRSSGGWVPTAGNEGTLLDKIFYTSF